MDSNKFVAFDTETHLVAKGLLAPPLVCGSTAMRIADGRINGWIWEKPDVLDSFEELMVQDHITVGANVAYDLLVCAVELAKQGKDIMPAIFKALEEGRVYDVQIAEALNAIADGYLMRDPRTGGPLINPDTGKPGRYSLATCVDLVLGRKDAKKNDEWRLRYAELEHIPIENWPAPAKAYPVDDAVNTLEVGLAQARKHRNLHDLSNQVYTHFAMHLGAAWGFHVNQKSVDIIERHALKKHKDTQAFVAAGILRADGSQDLSRTKKLVAQAYGAKWPCPACAGKGKVPSPKNPKSMINCHVMDGEDKQKTCDGTGLVLTDNVPRSEKEGVGYGRDVLHESGDEFLMEFADWSEDAKDLSVYVPYLRSARACIQCGNSGTDKEPHAEGCTNETYRDVPLVLRPNILLETGRTSYGDVIQLFKRAAGYMDNGEYIPSLRECIEARPGRVFSSTDYKAGELITHAQSCIWICGFSDLADALVNGINPHGAFAATMLGIGYEQFDKKNPRHKDMYQAAKWFNFSKPGGAGAPKIILIQRKQGPDTPCPNGPSMVKDGDNLVPGYKGLRFCILMGYAQRCGEKKITVWKDRHIPPTCAACMEAAIHLDNNWKKQWRESPPYFNYVQNCVENGQLITREMLERWPHLKEVFTPGQRLAPGEIMQHVSGRIRGGVEFTSAANGWFQGLLADAAKSALRRVSRECYDSSFKSVLYGTRVVVFAHDEIIAEHPEYLAHEGATRIGKIMVEELRRYCPDLAPAVEAEPCLMRAWHKSAETKRDANGRLIPWEP